MKIAFLVNDLQLSGGVGVVVQHARRLSVLPGWEVTLVLVREEEGPTWRGYEHLPDLHVRSRDEVIGREHFDVVVATWWETTFTLFELTADRYAYFVQSLEDRFYLIDQAERLGAGLTLDLPVAFITEARWIVDLLAAWRPDAACYLVRNGIDKDAFAPLERVAPSIGGPLRVLVEGSPRSWLKQVPETIATVKQMREPYALTVVCGDPQTRTEIEAETVVGPLSHRELAEVYAQHDVLVKLSAVEGMAGPPLEGFHRGTTCVSTPVTGHEEYMEHGFNGLVCDWDDAAGTARLLDMLASDRRYLHYLRTNALKTARLWPDWHQSSQFMAAAMLAIARNPAPDPAAAAQRLTADLRVGIEDYHARLVERADFAHRALRYERVAERVKRSAGGRLARRARHSRAGQLAIRPLRPLKPRLKRALS